MENKKILNKKQIAFLIIYMVSLMIPHIRPLKHTNISLWINILRYCILGLSSFIIFKEMYNDSKKSWQEKSYKNIICIIAVFVIDIVVTSIAQIPSMMLFPEYVSANSNNIAEAIKIVSGPVLLIALGILGPITEEIIFRGILVGKLSKKIPTIICMIISSILFMLIHVHTIAIEEILYYLSFFTTGIIYSITYYKTKNITLTIILHIMNNFPAILCAILAH